MIHESHGDAGYKEYIQKMLQQDSAAFCPFRKERQMDYLFEKLKEPFRLKGQRILEAGCGYGRLINFLYEFDKEQYYHGIDYVQELVEQAKARFESCEKVTFECGDLCEVAKKYQKNFDIAISYKTLSWINYYEEMLRALVAVARKRIYITSLFYAGDIDFITKIYANPRGNDDAFFCLNTYSLPKFEAFCCDLGVKKVEATNMSLDIDIQPSVNQNVLQTYTQLLPDGRRLEITGNIILNWKLIELSL